MADLGKLWDETPAAQAAPKDLGALWDETPSPKETPSQTEAALRGGAQGLTLGFSDEITGAAGGAWDWLTSKEKLLDAYRKHRDEARAANAAAEAAHGGMYLAGEVGGGLASLLVPGAALGKGVGAVARFANPTTAKGAIKLGAALGAGNSEADLLDLDVAGLAKDTAIGGALGAGGHAAGAVASKVGGTIKDATLGKLAGLADDKIQSALLKAEEMTIKDAAKGAAKTLKKVPELEGATISEAADKLGRQRVIEDLLRKRSSAGRASSHAMRQDETVQRLTNPNFRGDAVPGQTEFRKEMLERAQQELPVAVQERAAKMGQYHDAVANRGAAKDLATGEQLEAMLNKYENLVTPRWKKDAGELFESYGEPWLGGMAGNVAGTALGALGGSAGSAAGSMFDSAGFGGSVGTGLGIAGGLLMGRTRMGKAIQHRINRPGNQIDLWSRIGRTPDLAGKAGGKVLEMTSRGAQSPAVSAAQGYSKAFPNLRNVAGVEDEDDPQQQISWSDQ